MPLGTCSHVQRHPGVFYAWRSRTPKAFPSFQTFVDFRWCGLWPWVLSELCRAWEVLECSLFMLMRYLLQSLIINKNIYFTSNIYTVVTTNCCKFYCKLRNLLCATKPHHVYENSNAFVGYVVNLNISVWLRKSRAIIVDPPGISVHAHLPTLPEHRFLLFRCRE